MNALKPTQNSSWSTLYFSFIVVLALKLVLLAGFSSNYQNQLFIPFVTHFITTCDNSWNYFYLNHLPVEFPYPPLMLYLLSIFCLPITYLSVESVLLRNFIFKMPLVIADITMTGLLLTMFPQKRKEVLIYYFSAPIIIYGIYVHSQLDIIPATLLFISIYLLMHKKVFFSAVAFGLAVSTKFYVAASLPLIAIYLLKSKRPKDLVYFIILPAAIYLFFAFPYIQSTGYYHLVLKNPKQMQIFDLVYHVKDLSLYLPILAIFITYARFSHYKKINEDLFFTYLLLLFSLFVLLVYPAPAWYVWLFPFLSIFFIKSAQNQKLIYAYAMLSLLYLIFFIFLYIPDHQDIIFMQTPIYLKWNDEKLRNIVYTGFEAALVGCVYIFYRYGVRSNSVYNRNSATVIGIGGDSGAGKSTLLRSIKMVLKDNLLDIEGDGEHKWERSDKNWNKFTHLNPKSNLLHNQANYLLALKRGNTIYRHDYDHATGKFTPPRKVAPKEFIVLSGLHPFYLPVMRKIIDVKIYLDTDEALRRHWKIIRDSEQRGYTTGHIVEQIEVRIRDAQKYIHPQKEFADIVLHYYADESFAVGSPQANPTIKLKITLDSNIRLENVVDYLLMQGAEIDWEYADDLRTQYIVLNRPVGNGVIREIANKSIINLSEITANDCEWQDGYQGFVQLIVLLTLSERMRGFDNEI